MTRCYSSRMAACFERLQKNQQKAFIPFLTAGDISMPLTLKLMHAAVDAGVDIIELGVPFSDPMADGPVIQRSSERALAQGVTLRDVLELVGAFRATNLVTPIVLMGYLNPIEQMGWPHFAEMAQQKGVDGILIVDLPPEESTDVTPILAKHDIDQILLIAPTTTAERMQLIAKSASGYVYYVSLKGVTGSGVLDGSQVKEKVESIQKIISLPVCVGFGIRDAKTAAEVASFSAGVVMGSHLVQMIYDLHQSQMAHPVLLETVSKWMGEIRRAIDQK